MKIENKYFETLEALVSKLRTTAAPDSWQVYATIRALVQDLLLDLSTEDFHGRNYPEGQLKGLLLFCRQAVFLQSGQTREDSLREAEVCIGKARSVQ
jgi:hypothetical protein